jgi:macrophage erythroblast attacher
MNPPNLEAALLKVTFEQVNKEFRNTQKSIEKDLLILEKVVKDPKPSVSLEKIENKIKAMKRKLSESTTEQQKIIKLCETRYEYLSTSDSPQFSRDKLCRLVVEYLCRNEYYETAILFAREKKIENYCDIEVFLKTMPIIDELKKRNCTQALAV